VEITALIKVLKLGSMCMDIEADTVLHFTDVAARMVEGFATTADIAQPGRQALCCQCCKVHSVVWLCSLHQMTAGLMIINSEPPLE
jgi:hypothetical protein